MELGQFLAEWNKKLKVEAIPGPLGAPIGKPYVQTFQKHVLSYLRKLHHDYTVVDQSQ